MGQTGGTGSGGGASKVWTKAELMAAMHAVAHTGMSRELLMVQPETVEALARAWGVQLRDPTWEVRFWLHQHPHTFPRLIVRLPATSAEDAVRQVKSLYDTWLDEVELVP